MSFGGSVSAMVTTLKNNKRSRVSTFKKMKNYQNVKCKKGTIDKKASPQLLKEIQKENKKNKLIAIISTTSIVTILYILFNFVKF